MPRQPLNIVVLGGSYGGLAVSHQFLDNVIHRLSSFEGAPTYRLILVSPSTHHYWNICAPRALVSASLIRPEDTFIPIEPAFARHPFNEFTFVHGAATDVDTSAKRVKIELVVKSKEQQCSGFSKRSSVAADRKSRFQTISYHALIIATGSSSTSPLFSLHGAHEDTVSDIKAFHCKLETASSVIVIGGGPSGVETAGQLATFYNTSKRRTFKAARSPLKDAANSEAALLSGGPQESRTELSKRDSGISNESIASPMKSTTEFDALITAPRTTKSVTLLSGGVRLLPTLAPAVGKKAEKQLKKLGVHIVHGIRQVGHTANADGSVNCILNNDSTITSDVLVEATGVYPNTSFLPDRMLHKTGHVLTNPRTLRVLGPVTGDRIYAIGDCASYSRHCTSDIYAAVPVLAKNLYNDLLAHEYKLQAVTCTPALYNKALPPIPALAEKETQKQEEEEEAKPTPKPPPSKAATPERPRSLALSLAPLSMSDFLRPRLSFPARSSTSISSPATPLSTSTTATTNSSARRPLLTSEETRRKINALQDAYYAQERRDLVLMPTTRFGGVGVYAGKRVPSYAVYVLKGRKYRLERARDTVERGRDPYRGK